MAYASLELSSDASRLEFGGYLAGRTYELTVQMNISVVGRNYAQRMSLGLSDTSDVPVGGADLCLQIGTDGSGGLGVFKRVNAASHAGGGDLNVRLTQGLAIGTPITLRARIVDYNGNVTDYGSD